MRIRKSLLVIITLVVMSIAGVIYLFKSQSSNKSSTKDLTTVNISDTLPQKTLEEWTDWRDLEIKKIFTPTFDAGGEKVLLREDVIAKSGDSYKFLQSYLSDPEFLKDPQRAKVLANFVAFVKAQTWMSLKDQSGKFTHALGMDITDKDYWDYIKDEVTFPELLKSQEFLKLMANPGTYKQAIEMINVNNASLAADRKWIVYPFRAQFIKSVDKTTYGRMLILIPNEPGQNGDLTDKWVLFSIATPDLDPVPEVKSVSIISVKTNAATVGKNKAFLADFMREKDPGSGNIIIQPTYTMEADPSKNCYDCHKAAVLPIRPESEFSFAADGKMIDNPAGVGHTPKEVNKRIKRYGKSDLGHLISDSYGPSLGPDDKVRTIDFVKQVTKGLQLNEASYSDIINSMDCASCHDDFAPLNYLQAVRSNRDSKAFKSGKGMLQTYIEKGWMPPNNTLTDVERTALWKCLMAEYFDPTFNTGILIDWLKGNSQ